MGIQAFLAPLARRRELVAVLFVVTAVLVATGRTGSGAIALPAGVYIAGLVTGGLLALQAIGIVLVFRSNRVVNFAQVQMGSVAGLLFIQLVEHRVFLTLIRSACPPCFETQQTDRFLAAFPRFAPYINGADPEQAGIIVSVASAPGWLLALNYWLSAAIALTAAIFLSWLLYVLVIRRFAAAPRLILTLATVAAGKFAVDGGSALIGFLIGPDQPNYASDTASFQPPLPFRFQVGSEHFNSADALTLILLIAVAIALAVFFRRSLIGVVMRASSQNPARAQSLGVNVGAIGARAWIIAGAISGLASLLLAASSGQATNGTDYAQLVRVLTVASVGAMVSLPAVIAAALATGTMLQAVVFRTGSDGLTSGLLLAVLVVVLLAQRSRESRAEADASTSWAAAREARPIPPELARLPVVRVWQRSLVVILGGALVGLPFVISPGQTTQASGTLIIAMVGLSLLILAGWAGQISLGQMAFAAIGAWVAAVLQWPLPVNLVMAGGAGAAWAVIVGLPALRLRGQQLAVVTISMALSVYVLLLGPKYLGARLPAQLSRPVMLGISFEDPRSFYYLTLLLLAGAVAVTIGLRRSNIGRVLIASRDNERAAQSTGVNLTLTRLTAFAISGFMAAFAGGLMAYNARAVEVAAFDPDQSARVFLYSTIGGLSSVAGPIVGAVYRSVVDGLSQSALASLVQFLTSPGLGTVIVLLLIPGGLSAVFLQLRDAWLRRVADRHRIVVPSLLGDRDRTDELITIVPKVQGSGGATAQPRRFRPLGQWNADRRQATRRAS